MILFEETENPRRPERLILEEAGDLAADQFRESATRLERQRQALPPQQTGLEEVVEYFGFY